VGRSKYELGRHDDPGYIVRLEMVKLVGVLPEAFRE